MEPVVIEDEPVEMSILPLPPVDAAEASFTAPDVDDALAPDWTQIAPPSSDADLPPIRSMEPARPPELVALPATMRTDPAVLLSLLVSPALSVISPARGPETVAPTDKLMEP